VKTGHFGAILVGGSGLVLAAAVFAKDRAQLGRARTLLTEGQKLLAAGKTKDAQSDFRHALESALVVGGITGRRSAALEVAGDARRSLRLCEALLALEKDDPSGLDLVDEAASSASSPELKKAFEDASTNELARSRADTAAALERIALETDKRGGDAGRTKAELHALAEKAYALAREGERTAGHEPPPALAKGERRSHARSLVRGALAAAAGGDPAETLKLADEAEAALKDAADAFDAVGDAPSGNERERTTLEELVHGIGAEGRDHERVSTFESAVSKLDERVDSRELGDLLPEVLALKEPELEGRGRSNGELAKKTAALKERLSKIREAAEQFQGMALVVSTPVKVFVDRHEVTNGEWKKFVDETKPYGDNRTAEVWGNEAAAKTAADFWDRDAKGLGPATWKDGTFPPGEESHPVAGVSALEARAFAHARGKRLPTYDEWRAAGGHFTGGPEVSYPWGDGWRDDRANVLLSGQKPRGTRPVSSFPEGRSPTGVDDLVGNVREIVEDGQKILAVGGSYLSRRECATLESALRIDAETRPRDQGFRCAKELRWSR
jgi:hypothetical protein